MGIQVFQLLRHMFTFNVLSSSNCAVPSCRVQLLSVWDADVFLYQTVAWSDHDPSRMRHLEQPSPSPCMLGACVLC